MSDFETEITYCDDDSDVQQIRHLLTERNEDWMKIKDGSKNVNDSLRTVVLACIDSRVPVEKIFQAKPGELLVLKNAGNMITDDILRSLLVSIYELNARFLVVMGHTRCGMSVLGNTEKVDTFTKRLGLEALEKIRKISQQDPLKWFGFFEQGKWEENAIKQATYVRELLMEIIPECDVPCVIPAVYELDSGKVNFLDEII
jgi:carbonic anhydrase